jgi:hypothetical protein
MIGVSIHEWMASLELQPCTHCGGTGKCLDDARVGACLRQIREAHKLTLREVARRMKFSAAYVSDMELGRRGWDDRRVTAYLQAVQGTTP